MRRSLVPALVAALALTMSVTACGADAEEPGVATLNDTDGGSGEDGADGEEAGSEKDLEEQALEYAECMRENGVPDFPDPQIEDGGIRMQIGGPDGELDPEALDQANEVCQDLAPRGGGNFSEEDRQEMQDAFLEYAQCMRDNGYDMPDPQFGEGGEGGMFRMRGEPDDPAFQKAQEACEDKLPGRPGVDE